MAKKGGAENLKPFHERTEEEQREIRVKGGKASGKARRRKKELKELLELALSQPDMETGEDNYMAIVVSLINEGKSGNVKAFEVIRDTLGQKPIEQQQMDMTAKVEIDYGES